MVYRENRENRKCRGYREYKEEMKCREYTKNRD